jgi:hypothetical protein
VSKHPCVLAVLCVGFLLLGSGLWAQVAVNPGHVGVPQDWSSRHVVFSLDGLARHPNVIEQEPRIAHQMMQRFPAPGSSLFQGVGGPTQSAASQVTQRDWNVALGRGHVATNMFPGKYSFDPGAPPSCANDYVVFGLNTAGVTGGQANLVGFNNLYAGTGGLCGAAPTVLFAYNVSSVAGGTVLTSPVISVDGTKIAFVESVGTSAVFHVLTWTAGQGSVLAAAAPSAMTTSAPWVDYSSDTAYVGSNNGRVYKITGVFKGTPTLAGAPWPVAVSTLSLSPPVLDNRLGLLMVGARDGNLYQINVSTGAFATVVIGARGGTSPGVLAAPIVDVTNGTTLVVSANDGTSAVLVEVDTATLVQMAKGRIGLGSKGGTSMTLYEPALSDKYYTNPTTGTINLCGTGAADTTPWRYSFGFTGRTMKTTPTTSRQLLTSTAARCTGWMEFLNPNIGPVTGTDFFFFGLTQDCTGTGTSGCVVELAGATTGTAPIAGGSSSIVVDNYSTAGQASSIYFTAEKANTAYKLTQNGLQ